MSERPDFDRIRRGVHSTLEGAEMVAYVEGLEQRAETLAAQVERLRDALATYADRAQWIRYGNSVVPSYEFRDGSAPWTVARAALAAAPAPAERGTA